MSTYSPFAGLQHSGTGVTSRRSFLACLLERGKSGAMQEKRTRERKLRKEKNGVYESEVVNCIWKKSKMLSCELSEMLCRN
jgi:hypothetical protein